MVAPNHMGFLEGLALCAGDVHPGFAPKIELKRLLIVGKIFMALQSIYIDRFADASNRDAIVNQIIAH